MKQRKEGQTPAQAFDAEVLEIEEYYREHHADHTGCFLDCKGGEVEHRSKGGDSSSPFEPRSLPQPDPDAGLDYRGAALLTDAAAVIAALVDVVREQRIIILHGASADVKDAVMLRRNKADDAARAWLRRYEQQR